MAEAPTTSELRNALGILLAYGEHGAARPDPPAAPAQQPPAPTAGTRKAGPDRG